jgi:hypothetical protein
MFTANHPLVFRALQCALIRLPGIEDGQFLAGRNACCLDYIHGVFESAWVECCLTGMQLVMHGLLLCSLFVLRIYMLVRSVVAKHRFSALP